MLCDNFALITEGQGIADELEDQCPLTGSVIAVFYAIEADEAGQHNHVALTRSADLAQALVKRMTFESGLAVLDRDEPEPGGENPPAR